MIAFASRIVLALMLGIGSAWAQENAARLTIVGVDPQSTMQPLLDALRQNQPGAVIDYRQARPSQIISRLITRTEGAEPVDVVILPTPDLAVYLANEGSAARHAAAPAGHWRNEVFSIGYDPAVFVSRRGGLATADIPRTRTDLAWTLEQNRARFQRRVGLVNIGIDNVSYAFAAQDSLRSPLFWRIARAFGASQARIYDTSEELLAALSAGEIDLGYNVPLSAVRKWKGSGAGIDVVVPEDYVVALPWTVLLPEQAGNTSAGAVVDFLLSQRADAALGRIGLTSLRDLSSMENIQPIELGPELLVHLDGVKRSRFLDTWFQLVIQE